MKNTTSAATIKVLRQYFAAYGLPEQIVSDNGPQFASVFFLRVMESSILDVFRIIPPPMELQNDLFKLLRKL